MHDTFRITILKLRKNIRSVVADVQYCDTLGGEFELQVWFYVNFLSNIFMEAMYLLIPLAIV